MDSERQKLVDTVKRAEVAALLDKIQTVKQTNDKNVLRTPSIRPETVAKNSVRVPIKEEGGKAFKFLPLNVVTQLSATGKVVNPQTGSPTAGTTPGRSTTFSARGPQTPQTTPTVSGNSLAALRAQARATGSSNRNVTLTAMSAISGMRFGFGVASQEANTIRNIGARRWILDQIDHPDPNLGRNLRNGRDMWMLHYNSNTASWPYLALLWPEWQQDAAQRIYNSITSPTPFMARMAEFWSEHFGLIGKIDGTDPGYITIQKALGALAFHKDVSITHMNGYFGDMLLASSEHNAMLTHLNGSYSALVRDANGNFSPIQNYARELMQLHSVSNDPRNYNFAVQHNLLTNANLQYAFHTTDRSRIFQGGSTLPVYNTNDIREVAMILGGRGVDLWMPNSSFMKFGVDSSGSIFPGNGYPQSFIDGIRNTQMLPGLRNFYVPFLNFEIGSYWDDHNAQLNGMEVSDFPFPNNAVMANPQVASQRRFFRRLAVHPATAVHLSGKMIKYFISADPYAPEMVPLLKEMVRAWINSNGHLPTVYRAMINHNLSFSMDERIAKPVLKDPLLYMASIVRTLEKLQAFTAVNAGQPAPPMSVADKNYILANILGVAEDLGMHISFAPTVEGWLTHSNMYWKTPGGLMKRLDHVMQIAADSVSDVSPQTVYTRVLSSRLSTRSNSRAILTDTDPTRALAAVLLSPEFQYTT